MTEIRAELAVADAADPDGSRPLDVDDFKADQTGAGKETTQSAIKTVLEAIRDRLPAALSGGRLKTEITQAAGTTVLVESSTAVVTAITYFATADARNGRSQTYTEERENGDERTVTITRDTATGAITAQSATPWA